MSFNKHVHVRMACLLEAFDAQKCFKKAIGFIFFTMHVFSNFNFLKTTTSTKQQHQQQQ